MARSFRSDTSSNVVKLSSRVGVGRRLPQRSMDGAWPDLHSKKQLSLKLSKNFPLLTTTEMLAGHSRASRPLPVKNVGSSFTENMREPSQHGSN